jgi:hypothetical protein
MINVFVYVDALPYEEINSGSAPFLHWFVNEGRTYKLQNIMGYSFGIQSTMLSGRLPSETKHFMPYVYAPNASPFLFKFIARLARKLSVDVNFPRLLKIARYGLMSKFILKRGAKVNFVPWNIIDKFFIYPYYYMNELPFFADLKTNLESKYGVNLLYFGPPISSKPIIDAINHMKSIIQTKNGNNSLLMVYLDTLDRVGHAYGVDAKVWKRTLINVDNELEMLYRFLSTHLKKWSLALFSDHGMCNVNETIDILGAMKSYRLTSKQFTIFVDATISLIWLEEQPAKYKVIKALEGLGGDKVTFFANDENREVLRRYGVLTDDNRFGDIIVQAMPGFMFFPNFYSYLKPFKGVHGFLPESKYQQSFLTLITNHSAIGKNLQIKINHIKEIRKVLELLSSLD